MASGDSVSGSVAAILAIISAIGIVAFLIAIIGPIMAGNTEQVVEATANKVGSFMILAVIGAILLLIAGGVDGIRRG